MRAILCGLVLTSAACAHQAAAPAAPRAIHFVTKTPPARDYEFVGNIDVEDHHGGFVEQTRAVEERIEQHARALGADVVRVDYVSPGDRKHGVIMSVRAYRKLD